MPTWYAMLCMRQQLQHQLIQQTTQQQQLSNNSTLAIGLQLNIRQ